MKMVLDVKNPSLLKEPKKDQIIIFDGNKWYVTTKQDLFKEYEDKVDAKLEALEKITNELVEANNQFKDSVSRDIIKITDVVEKIYIATGKVE